MEAQKAILDHRFSEQKCCVIIPTYNNEKTLGPLLEETLKFTSHVLVINDGATDSTPHILREYKDRLIIVSFEKNQGKGIALRQGFKKAVELGYDHAITI